MSIAQCCIKRLYDTAGCVACCKYTYKYISGVPIIRIQSHSTCIKKLSDVYAWHDLMMMLCTMCPKV